MDNFIAYKLGFICEVVTAVSLPRYNGSTLRGAFFGALRRDFCFIDDELRQWFIEERDERMRMVHEEIDPGLAKECPGICSLW